MAIQADEPNVQIIGTAICAAITFLAALAGIALS